MLVVWFIVQVDGETVSADGFEMNFAVNTLAPFMLTNLLHHCLKLGGPGSKVIMVSSGGAYTAPLVIAGSDRPPADMDGTVRYAHDKRRQIAMAERFADILAADGIGAYSYHPGEKRSCISAVEVHTADSFAFSEVVPPRIL